MRQARTAACIALAVWLCLCAGCGKAMHIDGTTETVETSSGVAAVSPSLLGSTEPESITEEPSTDTFSTTDEETTETKHTHIYTSEVIEPTCTKGGYTIRTCTCGDTMRTDETEALGHAFGKPVVLKASTCTANGTQKNVCTRCGYSETVPSPRAPHDFTAWVVTQQSTENLKGEESCRCKVCGYTITREIPERSAEVYTEAQEALEMLDLINEARKQAGVRPLAFDYERYVCAEVRAKESVNSFSHTRPNGEDFITVVKEQGCTVPDAWAENLQYSTNPQNPVQRAHDMLMASEEHKENILNPRYATVAIYVLRFDGGTYIAQLFFA